MRATVQSLKDRFPGEKFVFLVSIMADKDVDEMLALLAPLAERFVTVNQKVLGESGDVVEIHNDITQGMYDVIVSDAPATDSVREQNMNLLIEWCKQSPPEVIPYLMGMAMEMSNLPKRISS